MKVDHIDIQVYGERNRLIGHVRVPADVTPKFDELLTQAQDKNPIYNAGLLVRWMLKSGYRSVQTALKNGQIELKPGGSPPGTPKTAKR